MKNDSKPSELRQLGSNAPLRLAGIFATDFLFLIIALLISRFRGAAGLGSFILAITVFNFLGIVGGLGLKQGALRYVAFFRGKNNPGRLRSVIRISLFIGLSFSVILGAAILIRPEWLAVLVFQKPELIPIFRILGAGLPIFTLSVILLSIIQGFKKIKLQILAENIARPALALILIVILIGLGCGVNSLIGAWIFSYLLVVILCLFWLPRLLPPPVPGQRSGGEARTLLGFSLPLLLVSVMHRLLANMDVMMLGYFSPLASVGIYGIAARLSILIAVPLEALDVIFAPVIAEISGRDEPDKLGELYRISTCWIIWAAAGAFALLLILASPLMGLFGRNFSNGELVLVILGLGQLSQVAVGSAGFLLAMTGHPRIILYNNITMGILNFLLNLYLIPRHGILGAATATAISWTIINLARLAEVKIILGLHPFSRRYWLPWMALAGSLTFGWLAVQILGPSLPLLLSRIITALIFSTFYGLIFLLFGLKDKERNALKQLIQARRNH
jgi:O-antigen/teichoic acid export membrane protein